jgi:hypothetical protein
VALAGAGTSNARAGVAIGLGVDAPINGRTSSVINLSYLTEQKYPWEFAVGGFPGLSARGGHDDIPTTYYAAISRRLTWRHWFISEGGVYDSANNAALSGHWQFQTAIGYQMDHWTISARHMSNAGIREPNHGETFALVQYGF